MGMLPVIGIGFLSISTFGIFLALGMILGIFLVWRIARAWDMNEEKILDLTLLTILGGILGARVYFILQNFHLFGLSLGQWLNFQKYPGFSFWGALLGGFFTLRFFTKKFRINSWQAADFALVGLLGGLILESLGCFFGGCNVGIPSKLFFAVPMVGSVGSRVPVQLVETIILSIIFLRVWKAVLRFHIQGTVAAICLIYIGLVMLLLTPLRQNNTDFYLNLILVITGIILIYRLTKRSLRADLKTAGVYFLDIFRDGAIRKNLVVQIKRSWYNTLVSLKWQVKYFTKFLRRVNVRFSHKDSKYY